MKIKRKRKKNGDVVALKMPNEKFIFFRKFDGVCVGFYDYIGNDINDLPKEEIYKFIVSVYSEVINEGVIVDHIPFPEEREKKTPLTYIKNNNNPNYFLLINGKMVRSNREDCIGFERSAVWGLEHIIERFMGGTKWIKQLEGEDFDDWEKHRKRRLLEGGFNKE